jgi:5-amino-6-(D-ribitylamino)uracil---L-tyrosine 4-hydroxyphenyl transferase
MVVWFSMAPPQTLDGILARSLSGQDLTSDEGVALLNQRDSVALQEIQQAADELRRSLCGDTVTYVINRNINFTNICEQHCGFCAFRRDEGDEDAYWLTRQQMLEKATDAVRQGATEICMQGGLHPGAKRNGRSLPYYVNLVEDLCNQFPDLHLHAFSPQEVEFIARQDNLSYRAVVAALHAAGVQSMPGTAAEVLNDEVRRVLCPEKIDTATWLEVVETAHQLGMPTTSTMLSGHIETPEQQIEHLDLLRSLQRRAKERGDIGITEFILLPYIGQDAPKPLRKKVGHDQPILADALHLTAIARLFLSQWIPNHQPSWVKLGLSGATTALQWGCNDLGGTLMEEHITSMAGAQGGTCMTVTELQGAIASIQRPWRQRTTLYAEAKVEGSQAKGRHSALSQNR